jgi:hypothetical protein
MAAIAVKTAAIAVKTAARTGKRKWTRTGLLLLLALLLPYCPRPQWCDWRI